MFLWRGWLRSMRLVGRRSSRRSVGFAGGHLAVVGLVVFAGEVEEAVEERGSLLRSSRVWPKVAAWRAAVSSEMARSPACCLAISAGAGKLRTSVGLFLPRKVRLRLLEVGVAGEEDVDLAGEADGEAGAVEEAREAGRREQRCFEAEAEVDGNHWLTSILCVGLDYLLRVSGVDADVIDEHLLREGRGVVGVAGPVAADGDVEKDVEGVVVDPLCAGGEIGWGALDDEVVVEEEVDVVGGPLDGVEVEGVVDGLRRWGG